MNEELDFWELVLKNGHAFFFIDNDYKIGITLDIMYNDTTH